MRTRRAPQIRAFLDGHEMIADLFAGGGGVSTGILQALGRAPDVAINHSPAAIAVHKANHPSTRHYLKSVWEVSPLEACRGRRVGFLWLSPDCRHFSRAKGRKPVDRKIRGLAWAAIKWAEQVRPRIICLENVAEFMTWGPLDADGMPIPGRAGETFRKWLNRLRALGYAVDFRELVAADYGAPTIRRRFFLVARCDGLPIEWPEPTHGEGTGTPWRSAAEIIDWSIPCRSIFGREKPLAEATIARCFKGLDRYVINAKRPGPFIIRHGHYSHRTGAGLREGCGAGTFRGQSLEAPLATVCATNDKHLVCPVITKHYGGMVGNPVTDPLGTITARDHHALTAAYVLKMYGTGVGSSMQAPLPTVTAGGNHLFEVRALLEKHAERRAPTLFDDPLGVVRIDGEAYAIVDVGMRMLVPRELYRAHDFPEDYEIAPEFDGKPLTQEKQTAHCGNSVPPPLARRLFAANALGMREAA